MSDQGSDQGDKFVMAPEGTVMTQCAYCANAVTDSFGRVCRSFPGGIPGDVIANEFDHRREHRDESPMDGVEPSRFEPRSDVPPAVLANLYATLDALPS